MTEAHARIDLTGVTAETPVRLNHHGVSMMFTAIDIDNRVAIYFDGFGEDCETNLLGFLDSMARIRDAVLQDRADRQADVA